MVNDGSVINHGYFQKISRSDNRPEDGSGTISIVLGEIIFQVSLKSTSIVHPDVGLYLPCDHQSVIKIGYRYSI